MIAWQRELETADSTVEVVSLARQYVEHLEPHERDALPRRCRPTPIREPEDVMAWSHCLTDEYWAQRNAGAEVGLLQDVWSFFLRAAVQLERVEHRAAALG